MHKSKRQSFFDAVIAKCKPGSLILSGRRQVGAGYSKMARPMEEPQHRLQVTPPQVCGVVHSGQNVLRVESI
jgi:hypothetical protein